MRWWDKFPKKLTALAVGLLVQLLPVSEDLKDEVRNLVLGFLGAQSLADAGAYIGGTKKKGAEP